jgi:hypothetical protein
MPTERPPLVGEVSANLCVIIVLLILLIFIIIIIFQTRYIVIVTISFLVFVFPGRLLSFSEGGEYSLSETCEVHSLQSEEDDRRIIYTHAFLAEVCLCWDKLGPQYSIITHHSYRRSSHIHNNLRREGT